MRYLVLLTALVFVACTTEPERSEKKWAVQVKDAQLVGNSATIPRHSELGDSAKAVASASVHSIWVWHVDGSKQCGKAKGIDPEKLANAVKARGVSVVQYRSAFDGQRHPLICGMPTGRTIELEISAKDLPKAKKLGLLEKQLGN